MSRPRFIVEIDELVLHGFDPRERLRIGDAVRAEMESLLAGTRTADMAPRSVDRVDGGHFQLERPGGQQVGQLTARSLHRSIF